MLSVAASCVMPFARTVILTQRGISQLLLTRKEEHIHTAPQELLFQTFRLSHHCALLLPFYSFLLILLRVLGQTFCEGKSILYYRNLSSTQCFYEVKGMFAVYSVYRIAIDILCIDSLLLRKTNPFKVELVDNILH